ncbi:MAG: alpha/beta hydrolase [Bacillota bacterium]|nr:alpha/beta hydrolase [Bacillota bacterium]
MLDRYPLLPGAEPFFFKGNDIGIMISLGFVGTPQSIRFLGEYIASQGYTVYAPRLKGHGTHFEDMEKCNYQNWIQSLEDGYHFLKQHCRDIFIIGQSMGGTLAINLANKKTPIQSIKQLLSLMDETRQRLPNVTNPVLAFQSVEDHIVPPENTDYIMAHTQSDFKEIIPLYNSYHVASMDNEKEFIAEQCCLFIEKYHSNQKKKRIL